MSDARYALPEGWVLAPLANVCFINPRHERGALADEAPVSFVPMAAVDHESGAVTGDVSRPYGQVRKGFTHFAEGDVLFARITPCMENGKIAIARGLVNGLGCGTTEFHVLRPLGGILPEYIHRYLRQESFRRAAAANMSGTAGQLRVPTEYLKSVEVPVAPLPEQRRIVAKIEALFEQSRTARAALDRIPPLLKKFRQVVLAAAFRGDLTRDWREQHPDVEPASALLERIRAERRRKWEENLRAKDQHPRRPNYEEVKPLDTSDLPSLPEGWAYTSVREVSRTVQYGYTQSGTSEPIGPKFLRITDIQDGRVDWEKVPYCEISHEEKAKYTLGNGDIVFARSGATTGKSYLITECPPSVFASYLIRVQPFPQVLPEYLYAFFQTQTYWDQITTRGNAQPNANARVLGSVVFPLAPILEQERVVASIADLFVQVDAIETAVAAGRRQAHKLEQSILARAFRGELIPQDPYDEPASTLLERAHAGRSINRPSRRSAGYWTGQKHERTRKLTRDRRT